MKVRTYQHDPYMAVTLTEIPILSESPGAVWGSFQGETEMNGHTYQQPIPSDGNGFDYPFSGTGGHSIPVAFGGPAGGGCAPAGAEESHYLAWYEVIVNSARKHPRMPLPPPPPPNAQYAPWPQPYSFEEWTQRVHRWYSYVVERSWAPPPQTSTSPAVEGPLFHPMPPTPSHGPYRSKGATLVRNH